MQQTQPRFPIVWYTSHLLRRAPFSLIRLASFVYIIPPHPLAFQSLFAINPSKMPAHHAFHPPFSGLRTPLSPFFRDDTLPTIWTTSILIGNPGPISPLQIRCKAGRLGRFFFYWLTEGRVYCKGGSKGLNLALLNLQHQMIHSTRRHGFHLSSPILWSTET